MKRELVIFFGAVLALFGSLFVLAPFIIVNPVSDLRVAISKDKIVAEALCSNFVLRVVETDQVADGGNVYVDPGPAPIINDRYLGVFTKEGEVIVGNPRETSGTYQFFPTAEPFISAYIFSNGIFRSETITRKEDRISYASLSLPSTKMKESDAKGIAECWAANANKLTQALNERDFSSHPEGWLYSKLEPGWVRYFDPALDKKEPYGDKGFIRQRRVYTCVDKRVVYVGPKDEISVLMPGEKLSTTRFIAPNGTYVEDTYSRNTLSNNQAFTFAEGQCKDKEGNDLTELLKQIDGTLTFLSIKQ